MCECVQKASKKMPPLSHGHGCSHNRQLSSSRTSAPSVDEHAVGRAFHFEGLQRLRATRVAPVKRAFFWAGQTRTARRAAPSFAKALPHLRRTARGLQFGEVVGREDHVLIGNVVSRHLFCVAVDLWHRDQRARVPHARLVCARPGWRSSTLECALGLSCGPICATHRRA